MDKDMAVRTNVQRIALIDLSFHRLDDVLFVACSLNKHNTVDIGPVLGSRWLEFRVARVEFPGNDILFEEGVMRLLDGGLNHVFW